MNILIFILIILALIIIIPIIYAIYLDSRTKSGANKIDKVLAERNFNVSQRVNYGNKFQVDVDIIHKKVAVGMSYPDISVNFLDFEQIIECKITENSNVISGGGVGRAVAGGFIAGSVGAIVGSNTKKSSTMLNNFSIDIITNDINNSVVRLKMVDSPIDINTYGSIYRDIIRFANDVYALIQSVISNKEIIQSKEDNKQDLDNFQDDEFQELEKLAELKEKGIITEQEFEESKNKILSKL
jgi:hypothetical protein